MSKMLGRKKLGSVMSPRTSSIAMNEPKHLKCLLMNCLASSPLSSLLIKSYTKSAHRSSERNILQGVNSILVDLSCPFSLHFRDVCLFSDAMELLNNYYRLHKLQDHHADSTFSIETQLVSVIQTRCFNPVDSKPLIHYGLHIYPIMKKHCSRLQKCRLQKVSCLTRLKDLPTVVTERGKEDSCQRQFQVDSSSSESIEIKKLADCIKQLFKSQNNHLVWKSQLHCQQRKGPNYLAGQKLSPVVQWDFSSIQQLDFQISTQCHFMQENYGLGELKRRFEKHKAQKGKQLSQVEPKKPLGHKRNPTQALHLREHLQNNPMTPKQQGKGMFSSSTNIPLSREKSRKHRKKDFVMNEAYLIKFDKSKLKLKEGKSAKLKQNISKEQIVRSKSKSKSSKSREKLLCDKKKKAQPCS